MAKEMLWIATVSSYNDNNIIRGHNLRQVLNEVRHHCSDSVTVVTIRRTKKKNSFLSLNLPRHFLTKAGRITRSNDEE